ncbi:hypothetical protein EDB80DRAFT_596082 [Ilyonectria destructans]|nr:hypothetical protein EDB80DRAFT_596082 [Ilyonectria destructans]
MSRTGPNADRRIAVDKAAHFLGTASIRFENLAFTKGTINRSNVNRIKALMQDGLACLPEKSNHQISAVIDKVQLEKALLDAGINQQDLLQHTADHVRLEFPHGYHLQCLQGRHRVEAARDVLPRRMWRWTIKLFSSEIKSETRRDLEEERSNEKDIEDGEFYYNIRLHEGHFGVKDLHCARKWWALLAGTKGTGARKTRAGEDEEHKSSKCDRLRQLFRHSLFSAAFDNFRDMPALYSGLRLSVINKLLSMPSIDENLATTNYVPIFWYRVCNGDKSIMARFDVHSLRTLDGTAPGANEAERIRLEALVTSGQILGPFNDTERKGIWGNICSNTTDCVVPTLWGFFSNLNYIRPIASCLERLVDVREHSLRISLSRVFEKQEGDRCLIQVSPHLCKSIYVRAPDIHFELAYRQLWIYAWREYQDLQRASRKKLAGTESRSANEVILWGLATLAYKLGFRSYKIERLYRKNPHQIMARRHLGAVRIPGSRKSAAYERCVEEVANYYVSAWEPRRDEESEGDEDEEADEDMCPRSSSRPTRSGLPRFEDHVRDKALTFIQHLHGPIESRGSDISSFFVLRSLYSQFFSEWEIPSDLGSLLADAPPDDDYYLYAPPALTKGKVNMPFHTVCDQRGECEKRLEAISGAKEAMEIQYEVKMAELEDFVQVTKERAETAEQKTQEMHSEVEILRSQLSDLANETARVETAEQKPQEMHSEVENLRSQLSDLANETARAETAEQKTQEMQSEVEILQSQLGDLGKQLAKYDSEIQNLAQWINERAEKVKVILVYESDLELNVRKRENVVIVGFEEFKNLAKGWSSKYRILNDHGKGLSPQNGYDMLMEKTLGTYNVTLQPHKKRKRDEMEGRPEYSKKKKNNVMMV